MWVAAWGLWCIQVASIAGTTAYRISVDKQSYDVNDEILATVDFGDDASDTDFVGIYSSIGADVGKPLSLVLSKDLSKQGQGKFAATHSGAMELRLVRPHPRRQTLFSVPVYVHEACPSHCHGHGKCQQGECVCDTGWEGSACGALASKGTSVVVVDPNSDIEEAFTYGAPISVTISNKNIDQADLRLPSADTVGVYRRGSPTYHAPLSKAPANAFVHGGGPGAEEDTTLTAPDESGAFVVRLMSGTTSTMIAESDMFVVAPPCKNSCSLKGKCVIHPLLFTQPMAHSKCECNAGYDLDDCSRSTDMVSLSVANTDDIYIDTPVQINFRRDVHQNILSGQDYVAVCALTSNRSKDALGMSDQCSMELYKFAISEEEKCADPDVPDPDPTSDVGTIDIMPYRLAEGRYFARYFRKDGEIYGQSNPFTVYPTCKRNCTWPQGTCSRGTCDCDDRWAGESCEQGNTPWSIGTDVDPQAGTWTLADFTVHWSKPTGVGSMYDWIGLYRTTSTSPADQLISYSYTYDRPRPMSITDNVRNGEVTLRSATNGTFFVRYVGAFDQKSYAESKPFSIYEPCPGTVMEQSCSGHGKCVQGVCVCGAAFETDDCSIEKGVVKVESPENVMLRPPFVYLTVSVTRPEGHYQKGDFVAVYRNASADTSVVVPLQFRNADAPRSNRAPGAPDKTVYNFPLVASLAPGSFKVAYVRAKKYVEVAQNTFEVVDTPEVQAGTQRKGLQSVHAKKKGLRLSDAPTVPLVPENAPSTNTNSKTLTPEVALPLIGEERTPPPKQRQIH